jgi:hypothetical protein
MATVNSSLLFLIRNHALFSNSSSTNTANFSKEDGRNDLGGGRWTELVGNPDVLNTFISGCRRKTKAD